MKQKILNFLIFSLLIVGCQPENKLKSDLDKLIAEWDYVLPLPSENDSINLLFIQSEMNWFRYKHDVSDSLCDLILSMDSTFHPALSFKAWDPLNLDLLEKAMIYAQNDTTVHRLALEADYAFWINNDTATAIQKFKEVYDKYPNSKTTNWCVGMSYFWAGQNDKAIDYYQSALEIDKDFPLSYEMMGWAYYMKKEYKESIINLEKSIDYGINDMNTFRLTGKAYENLDSLDKAKYYYNIADSLENH